MYDDVIRIGESTPDWLPVEEKSIEKKSLKIFELFFQFLFVLIAIIIMCATMVVFIKFPILILLLAAVFMSLASMGIEA